MNALTFGNGVAETRSFDLDYRLTGLADTGTNPVQSLTYSYDAADNAVEAPYRPGISLPRRGQRGYYNLLLDVETLSLSDLDEVNRWLKGELKPAVSGKKNPGTALGRGVRTLVVRLLGGEKRHYEARTGTFRP